MKLRNYENRGFTLIELLISISIFMIFMTIAAESYTSLVSANRKANDSQKIYREVRFVFDTLADEIRNGTLDYSCIDQNKLDVLCLENQNSDAKRILAVLSENGAKRSIFKFNETDKKLLVLRQERGGVELPWSARDWQSLTTENLPLENLSFTFFPLKDPYESANAGDDSAQWQPSVGIAMKVKGFEFQTTYSSRTYGKQSFSQQTR